MELGEEALELKKKKDQTNKGQSTSRRIQLGAMTKEIKAHAKHSYGGLPIFPGFKAEFNAHGNQALEHVDWFAQHIQQI